LSRGSPATRTAFPKSFEAADLFQSPDRNAAGPTEIDLDVETYRAAARPPRRFIEKPSDNTALSLDDE